MKRFGLTGGIATGKSTVSALFRAAGVPLLDADELARQVVEPGQPALSAIVERFPGVVGPGGQLDRAALGQRIFGDSAERAALNAILHPRIQALAQQRMDELEQAGTPFMIYDVPLLVENRLYESMDGVVLVTAPPQVQLNRLMQRNQLDEAQARARIDSQWPLDEKRRFATWIIDNGGSLEATTQQVQQVLAAMRAMT